MRQEGYYWCKYNGCWDIYYWNSNYFLFLYMDLDFKESEFEEIDNDKIVRKND